LYSGKASKAVTIKTRGLKDLDLADEDVLKRVDALASLLNFLTDSFWNTVGEYEESGSDTML
jgi:hypothetical protein